MRTKLAVAATLLLILAGCSTSNTAKTDATTPQQSATPGLATPAPTAVTRSGSGSLFAINEVGLGPDGYIALTNFTDQPATLGGLFLCQGAQCFALPDVAVAPQGTARVALGDGAGLEKVAATRATIGELRPADGEVALYASQNVKDPKAMLVYLEWGSTPHDNTQTAIDAGLWIKGSYAPSAKNATRLFRQDTGLWLFDAK